jgi:hypothetical protein
MSTERTPHPCEASPLFGGAWPFKKGKFYSTIHDELWFEGFDGRWLVGDPFTFDGNELAFLAQEIIDHLRAQGRGDEVPGVDYGDALRMWTESYSEDGDGPTQDERNAFLDGFDFGTGERP